MLGNTRVKLLNMHIVLILLLVLIISSGQEAFAAVVQETGNMPIVVHPEVEMTPAPIADPFP